MNTYHHLFSPIKVGHTTIKNRVFMPPISTNLAVPFHTFKIPNLFLRNTREVSD